jgi:hypothetical protein
VEDINGKTMRKLILALLLFSSLFANSQFYHFTILGSDGILIGGGEHFAGLNPCGLPNPWILYVHGIDHRRAHPISSNDTTRILVVEQKGTPKLVANAPLPWQQKPGTTGPCGLFRPNVMYVQADSDDNQWPADKIRKAVERIRTYGATTDTSLIAAVWYSLGGGAAYSLLKYTGIREYLKYNAIVAGGYINTPDYLTLASLGINIDVFATIGDQLVQISLADNWVNGIKSNAPQVVPNYFRFTDMSADNSPTDHDFILQAIVEDTTDGDSYPMTNGSTWTRDETIYERMLRFNGQTRKRNVFYWWLIVFIPLTRKPKPLNPLTLRVKREV